MADLSMMDPERWRQIDALLQAALERQPAERVSFLDEACAGDESLRSEVESLLVYSGDQALSLFNRPAFEMAAGLFDQGQPELRTGENIGHYEILDLLGAGGMGEVYLARDLRLGRKIALKMLPADFTVDKERVHRFQQEARSASALNHPNIITIHEIGQLDGRHFIATEFIEGETLRQRLRRGKMSVGQALDVAVQVASALVAAHEAGVIHRDIKPENIMLRRDGYIKILDFGLAKLTQQQPLLNPDGSSPDRLSTAPGMVRGTVSYMSPEQARGLQLDARSDIFSLGVVLYEILAGHSPFEGDTRSDVLASILRAEPLPLTHYAPDVPAELQRIIADALEKDRHKRYPSASEMLAKLQVLKRDLEVEGREPQFTQSQPSGQSTVMATSEQAAAQTGDELLGAARKTVARITWSLGKFITGNKRPNSTAAAMLVVAFFVLAATGYFVRRIIVQEESVPFRKFRITRIRGNARDAASSPDGRYIAYVVEENRKESIWISEVATNHSVQLIPPVDTRLAALTFSRDSRNL